MKAQRAEPTGRIVAGIYARKSTEQKNVSDEAKSVTRQVEQATAWAAGKGWTVDPTQVYVDDGISGAEFEKRPGFLRMMQALTPRPPFQVLITMDESRLGRDQFQTGYALWQIIDAGVRVFYYLPDREVKLDNATSGFLEQVKLFAAQIERETPRTGPAMRC
jgi:DNA invertase Pin-like site-specific DNA recombinase